MKIDSIVTECRMEDKAVPSKNTKNNDCYFYYYSSCSKGDACPFRHEPAALRNETVCIFWLQGHCNKANCIFRHMELTKQRDKIPCWFESQPGGCKKPHCPFQHQNIMDHPREEDIKKQPDLILPVRKDEFSKDDVEDDANEETERQIMLARNEVGSVTPPGQAHFSAIPRNPIIVPLQDGESDSESVSGSPYKRGNPELSAQLEWELRKLRQIQAHEADIIGYVFADDAEDGEEEEEEEGDVRYEDESMAQTHDVEEYVVEEILEVEEEPDAAHRRLHPPERNSPLNTQAKSYPDPILSDYRKTILMPQVSDSKARRKVQISERLGGLASRALAETLGTSVQLRQPAVKRHSNRKEDQASVVAKTVAERLGKSPSKKLSMLDRLGTRHSKEPPRAVRSLEEETGGVDRSIATRIVAIRNLQDGSDEDTIPDSKTVPTSSSLKGKEPNLDFKVKSLADIRAENQRKGTVRKVQQPSSREERKRVQSNSEIKNGTKLHAGPRKVIELPRDEGDLKILSLSEIKAKQPRNNLSSVQSKKRSISPVSFGRDQSKLVLKNSSSSVQQKKRSISPISFGSENQQKSVPNNDSSLGQQQKKSVLPISFEKDNTGYKKIRLSTHSNNSVQISLGTERAEQNVSALGLRKITINKSPTGKTINSEISAKKPLTGKRARKEETGSGIDSKLKVISIDNSKNNNNVPLGSTKPISASGHQPSSVDNGSVAKDSSEKLLNSSTISRLDSLIDEEEELLLGGEMLDDEDDIDEAALLL